MDKQYWRNKFKKLIQLANFWRGLKDAKPEYYKIWESYEISIDQLLTRYLARQSVKLAKLDTGKMAALKGIKS